MFFRESLLSLSSLLSKKDMPASKDIERKTYDDLIKQMTKEHYKHSLSENYDLDPKIIRQMEVVRLKRKIKYYQEQIWPWLERYAIYCLNMLFEILQELEGGNTSSPATTSTKEKCLTHNQIALLHFYNKEPITTENHDEVAKSHGWVNRTSGHKIYQCFNRWSRNDYRLANPEGATELPMNNKIELFQSIEHLIIDKEKQRHLDELNILRSRLSNPEN
jgi:hypothetical protein